MDNFAFNAPNFFDFVNIDDAKETTMNAENFFETEHQEHNIQVESIGGGLDEKNLGQLEDFYTPLKETPDGSFKRDSRIRRSISMVCLPVNNNNDETPVPDDKIDEISDGLNKIRINSACKKTPSKSCRSSRKSHKMTTRADMPQPLRLRSRSIARGDLDQIKPKRKHLSYEDIQKTKYVSMAEAIISFHHKTPVRFHSKPQTTDANCTFTTRHVVSQTIPQSPMLITKQRARPNNTVLSREETELKEFEEAQRHKIKAHPINMKVLNGPVQIKTLPEWKKPPTKPEPFNLTEAPARKAAPSQTPIEFHANPVPKCVLEPPKPVIKNSLTTVAVTPKLMKRYPRPDPQKHNVENGGAKAGPSKPMLTKIAPFSFDERDKEMIQRREKLLNDVLKEEQKAREFHARPLPKTIFKSPRNATCMKRQKSDGSLKRSVEKLTEPTQFKAQPAKVLQMKPFEPKKDELHEITVKEFQLSTVYRAEKRQEYQQKKKEQEETIAKLLKEKEELTSQKEAEEALRLRKEAEYKAQPIRKYKAVHAVASKQLTVPLTPKISGYKPKNEENTGNKENLMNGNNIL